MDGGQDRRGSQLDGLNDTGFRAMLCLSTLDCVRDLDTDEASVEGARWDGWMASTLPPLYTVCRAYAVREQQWRCRWNVFAPEARHARWRMCGTAGIRLRGEGDACCGWVFRGYGSAGCASKRVLKIAARRACATRCGKARAQGGPWRLSAALTIPFTAAARPASASAELHWLWQ
ncbi:hypothetical protein B0H17DRAFT_1140515 [Mycena rosella]|uniref:Uncharacterized protein n=1 Tax=Mycena rosella TaxID=1033263 RepID=A0AAD7D1R9_MYCRO|nr:hypothetical protein B0H17DRAFT_1140515 [Mycena rosella]